MPKGTQAGLSLQEGRLVDAITAGVIGIERIKPKMQQIQADRGRLEKKLNECTAEKEALIKEGQYVNIFGDLQEFFRQIRQGSEFVNTSGILRAVIHHVEVDSKAKTVSVALNLPSSQVLSNPENNSAASESFPDTAENRQNLEPVSGKTVGDPHQQTQRARRSGRRRKIGNSEVKTRV